MTKTLTTLSICAVVAMTLGQTGSSRTPVETKTPEQLRQEDLLRKEREKEDRIANAENTGVEVRIKDVARFRGVRSNQLYGYGLVIGLDGSGDSRKTPFTMTLLQNALKDFGTTFDEKQFNPKNIAAVAVTVDLPPFAAPGNTVDVTVTSIGDAKSLKGGFLLQTPVYPGANRKTAFVVAQGAVDVGGFDVSSNGSSVSKGHVTVGRISGGGIVEASVPTELVFDGRIFLELNDPDFTTAERMSKAINAKYPDFWATALDGGTVQMQLPPDMTATQAIAVLEKLTFKSDTQALVVINPRTGTIVIGGNVRLGPATIVHGSLKVQIDQIPVISQPNSFTNGQTVDRNQAQLTVDEGQAKTALIPPTATLADLTRILQELKVTPGDLMQILDALRRNGALKAKIVVQ
jgi:flagellar P-ring protein FlgI